jgi:hypothetical protein
VSISGNQLRGGGSGDLGNFLTIQDLGSPDQVVELPISSWNEGSGRLDISVFARHDASNTYYEAFLTINNGSHSLGIGKVVSGSFTSLSTTSVTSSSGDVLKFEDDGTALKAYQNDTQRISITDSSITEGNFSGLFRDANSSSPFMLVDDFLAVTNAGGGGSGTPMEVIQVHEETGPSGTSINFNFPLTPTAGNRIIVVATSGSAVTFTEPSGFTMDPETGQIGSRVAIMSKLQTTGNSFTVTRSTTGGDWRVVGLEVPPCELDVQDTTIDPTSGPGGDVAHLDLGPTTTTTFAKRHRYHRASDLGQYQWSQYQPVLY